VLCSVSRAVLLQRVLCSVSRAVLLQQLALGQHKYCLRLFMNFIFGRASDLYLYLYNQLFALFHYVFKFLTPENFKNNHFG